MKVKANVKVQVKSVILSLLCFMSLFSVVPAWAENNSHPSAVTSSAASPVVKSAEKSAEKTVNINTADAAAIAETHLKGIGKKRAEAIVAYRQQHGPFKSITDLKNIRGISDKVLDANRERIILN